MFALTLLGLIVASLAFLFNFTILVKLDDEVAGLGLFNSVLLAFIIVVLSISL